MRRSGIEQSAIKLDEKDPDLPCVIYHLDIAHDGQILEPVVHSVSEENTEVFWDVIKKPVSKILNGCTSVLFTIRVTSILKAFMLEDFSWRIYRSL